MPQQPLVIERLNTRDADIAPRLAALREKLSPRGDLVSESGRARTLAVFGAPLTPQQVVERICSDVQHDGLHAVLRYSKLLDQADLAPATLRVSADELQAAHAAAAPEFLAAIRRIRDNILHFQRAILHADVECRREPGIVLRQRYRPLKRVGICVPGGAAAYPSTVLMTACPALAAGVEEIAVVAPPTGFGANNPDVLATCHELGIREVYRVGGAQGVAALAYGVEGLAAVDKIVGPGNLFVALAKKHVFGVVDIDSIAGPSEIVIVADDSAQSTWIAADMLAQAEHAPGSSILITWDAGLLEHAAAALQTQLAELERGELARQSLADFGALICVRDRAEACRLVDLLAPEHLHLACRDPHALLAEIRSAGATFVGHAATVALGDYIAGPSHVLPTGGTARWAAGLTANDFLRGGSVIEYTAAGLQADAADAMLLAEREGLTAHRRSIAIRLQDSPK